MTLSLTGLPFLIAVAGFGSELCESFGSEKADQHAGGHHQKQAGEQPLELIHGKTVGQANPERSGQHAGADNPGQGR